ncbi:hypothetical protein LUZ61_006514 [Rhynchospora tenuis]|uniref:Elongin-C n=1 Tax=Rhynchospora tenuis TaxID=198213 RepID=A0AAD5ZRZ1_9POAL|nr:hypothetical protein LUZ61_006514 [Rhynchospora tenuis]
MTPQETVKLVSADGLEFVVPRNAAMISKTIQGMLSSPVTQQEELHFPEIRGVILKKVCEYFSWALRYSRGEESEFPIEPEIALELMMAAYFLDT